MVAKRFRLHARVSTDRPEPIRAVLDRWFARGTVLPGDSAGEFRVEAEMEGSSARDLNRALLSELRRAEKRTRLRAEWTCEEVTERFFDYVPKGTARS